MPQSRQARVFFGAGEIDQRLAGRIDMEMYDQALLVCENFFPTPYGGFEFRPGLRLRRTLQSQRYPDRLKMVRAPGYQGRAERILVLDGSALQGQIEAYAFPYAGNTRFSRTTVWTESTNRYSTLDASAEPIKNDLPTNIHEARVSFGDYAGTMICHRDFAPLHAGSAVITSTTALTQSLLLALDFDTSHLWQISRESPEESSDLGPMPPRFNNPGGMAQIENDAIAVSSLENQNALWTVNRSNPVQSQLIGIMNIADRVSGMTRVGSTIYAVTVTDKLWIVNRLNPEACVEVGEIRAPIASQTDTTISSIAAHGDKVFAVAGPWLIDVDLQDPPNSVFVAGDRYDQAARQTFSPTRVDYSGSTASLYVEPREQVDDTFAGSEERFLGDLHLGLDGSASLILASDSTQILLDSGDDLTEEFERIGQVRISNGALAVILDMAEEDSVTGLIPSEANEEPYHWVSPSNAASVTALVEWAQANTPAADTWATQFIMPYLPSEGLTSYGGELLGARGSEEGAVLIAIDEDTPADTSVVGNLPPTLTRPSAMVGYNTMQPPLEQQGELLDEEVTRNDLGDSPTYFTPYSYVDVLGNAQGEGGHPACATVFLNRMIFGGSMHLPGTFVGSELYPRDVGDEANELSLSFINPELLRNAIADAISSGLSGPAVSIYQFYWLFLHPKKTASRTFVPVDPRDSFSYKINYERELSIVWMVPYNNYLVIGTDRGIWIARDLNPDTPPEVTQFNNIPVGDVDPVITDFGIAYADAARKEVHVAGLGVGFEAPHRRNLVAFARHLTEGTRIRQLAWQATPQRRLWMLTEAGTLAAFCYEPDANVMGWARVTSTYLRFCGVCVIPSQEAELPVIACYDTNARGLTTVYLTTLDGSDHLDLGHGDGQDIDDERRVTGPGDEEDTNVYPEDPMQTLWMRVHIASVVSVQAGQTITLTVSREGTTQGAITYTWSIVTPGRGTLMPHEDGDEKRSYTAPTGITGPTSVTVRVVVEQEGIVAADTAEFTVLLVETLGVEISATTPTRVGTSATYESTLTATVGGTAAGALTYAWSIVSGTGVINGPANQATANLRGTGAGTVSALVTVTRQGLTAEDTHDVVIPDVPSLSVSISGPSFVSRPDVFQTNSVQFTADVGGTATGSITYLWEQTEGSDTLLNTMSQTVTFRHGFILFATCVALKVTVTRGGLTTTATHRFSIGSANCP